MSINTKYATQLQLIEYNYLIIISIFSRNANTAQLQLSDVCLI